MGGGNGGQQMFSAQNVDLKASAVVPWPDVPLGGDRPDDTPGQHYCNDPGSARRRRGRSIAGSVRIFVSRSRSSSNVREVGIEYPDCPEDCFRRGILEGIYYHGDRSTPQNTVADPTERDRRNCRDNNVRQA
jgi:hypothetical protein